jgi:hypothetical protein
MRYHRYINGKKEIKDFPPLSTPIDDNWIVGMGPFSPETLAKVRASNNKFLGVPKSLEQKQKMSEASKGKPKSLEHRKKMSEARLKYLEKTRRE